LFYCFSSTIDDSSSMCRILHPLLDNTCETHGSTEKLPCEDAYGATDKSQGLSFTLPVHHSPGMQGYISPRTSRCTCIHRSSASSPVVLDPCPLQEANAGEGRGLLLRVERDVHGRDAQVIWKQTRLDEHRRAARLTWPAKGDNPLHALEQHWCRSSRMRWRCPHHLKSLLAATESTLLQRNDAAASTSRAHPHAMNDSCANAATSWYRQDKLLS